MGRCGENRQSRPDLTSARGCPNLSGAGFDPELLERRPPERDGLSVVNQVHPIREDVDGFTDLVQARPPAVSDLDAVKSRPCLARRLHCLGEFRRRGPLSVADEQDVGLCPPAVPELPRNPGHHLRRVAATAEGKAEEVQKRGDSFRGKVERVLHRLARTAEGVEAAGTFLGVRRAERLQYERLRDLFGEAVHRAGRIDDRENRSSLPRGPAGFGLFRRLMLREGSLDLDPFDPVGKQGLLRPTRVPEHSQLGMAEHGGFGGQHSCNGPATLDASRIRGNQRRSNLSPLLFQPAYGGGTLVRRRTPPHPGRAAVPVPGQAPASGGVARPTPVAGGGHASRCGEVRPASPRPSNRAARRDEPTGNLERCG